MRRVMLFVTPRRKWSILVTETKGTTRPGDLACLQVARLIHSPSASVLAIAALASLSPPSCDAVRAPALASLAPAGHRRHRGVEHRSAGFTPLASLVTSSRALRRST